MPEARFCPDCGAIRKPPGATFCRDCGHRYPLAEPAQEPAAQPAPADTVVTAASPPTTPTDGLGIQLPAGVGVVSAIGGVLILVGGFLPWLTLGGGSISAWDIPVNFLISESASQSGLKVGPILLVAAALAAPYLTKKALPHWVMAAVAALAINAATLSIVRGSSNDLGLSAGLFMTLAGGVLVAYEWFRGRQAVAAPRVRA